MQRALGIVAALALVASASASATDEAQGVLTRFLGKRAKDFSFHETFGENGKDAYEYQVTDGHVIVGGATAVSMCRGAYDYLKSHHYALCTWDGDNITLPNRFPDEPKRRVVCPNLYRHYFNVCTFGYTTAFWDWKRWRREIDWMALHGINMPLSMNGQEAIWRRVWQSYGLTDSEILSYFTGPAFLPWHRMGNINHHGGPMPLSFLEHDEALQKQILHAELALGMKPVTPGFSSFVPPAFARRYPQAKVRPSSGWAGFEPTLLLDPFDPKFSEIGRKFIETYREVYGETAHLYLADVYNEMTPQVSADHKFEDLAASATATLTSMQAGDPQAVWVMQGWLFFNEKSYWGEPEISAYLGGVPDDKMILLDLAANDHEIWRDSAAFRKKPYIWNMLHNFGQNTRLFGNLRTIFEKPFAALRDPNNGHMVGMGMTPEGIEQNAVMYEVMSDNMWRTTPISDFNYFSSRGLPSGPEVVPFTSYMAVAYGGRAGGTMSYQEQPGFGSMPEDHDIESGRRALKYLIGAKQYHNLPLVRRDFVDIAKDVIGEGIDHALGNTVEAYATGQDPKPSRKIATELMLGLDSILATIPQHRLDRWIRMARSCVPTKDQPILEENARMQVTVWGGPILSEYAAKEWSGLLSDYYLPRWERLFNALDRRETNSAKFDADMRAWELNWCKSTHLSRPKSVDPYVETARLLKLIDEIPRLHIDAGIAVGKPTSDSGHSEPGGEPSKAVDGRISGGYWAASPAPQWWQVDLERPEPIRKIQVVTFSGDGRYYQYTVEASLDGVTWTRVADLSKNTELAVGRGFTHEVNVTARYVRVNMLFNSANVGVHLREVRIFR